MKFKAPKSVVAIALILACIMLIGQWYAYVSPPEHESDAELNGTNLTFQIDSKGAREYKSVAFDNADYVPIKKLYILFDEGYASNVNENTSPPIGSPSFTQEYFIEQMEHFLSYRGMKDVVRIDADEMKSVIEGQISSDSCQGAGILLACGSIPNILFSGNADDLLPSWIEKGGSLYWVGNEIGMYISYGKDIKEIDGVAALTGISDATFCKSGMTKDESILREELSLLVYSTEYAIDGTGVKHYGYYDGTFSTVSCIGKNLGQICIVSGKFCMNLNKDTSNVICSGLSDRTSIVGYDSGTFRDSVEGEMTVPDTHGNLSLYLYIGSYHSIYGERYDFL